MGGGGSGLGYDGLSSAVAVEFDTYPSGDCADPATPHVSVHAPEADGRLRAHHRGSCGCARYVAPRRTVVESTDGLPRDSPERAPPSRIGQARRVARLPLLRAQALAASSPGRRRQRCHSGVRPCTAPRRGGAGSGRPQCCAPARVARSVRPRQRARPPGLGVGQGRRHGRCVDPRTTCPSMPLTPSAGAPQPLGACTRSTRCCGCAPCPSLLGQSPCRPTAQSSRPGMPWPHMGRGQERHCSRPPTCVGGEGAPRCPGCRPASLLTLSPCAMLSYVHSAAPSPTLFRPLPDWRRLEAWSLAQAGESASALRVSERLRPRPMPAQPRRGPGGPCWLPQQMVLHCHDMQGGYTSDVRPQGGSTCPGYAFAHWQHVDVFCYFSHAFVSPPTPAWANAAHRHGAKEQPPPLCGERCSVLLPCPRPRSL